MASIFSYDGSKNSLTAALSLTERVIFMKTLVGSRPASLAVRFGNEMRVIDLIFPHWPHQGWQDTFPNLVGQFPLSLTVRRAVFFRSQRTDRASFAFTTT
jgi:hypothetical protein